GAKPVDLTILGNGDTIARVASAGYFRLFDVAPGASLTLEHMTLQGGEAGTYGGAIFNQGTLTVSSSILFGNTARSFSTDGGYGGGIYNAGGTVTVRDSTLSGNTAELFAYFMHGGDGGAIYNSAGTVVIDNSILSGNTAFVGGGIYNDPNGTV